MASISISLEEVAQTSARIRSLNQSMYEELTDMKRNMNLLNGSWISEGGETIHASFNTFANKFEKQKEIIDSYARFLDLTVSSYDSLESTVTGNAAGIQY